MIATDTTSRPTRVGCAYDLASIARVSDEVWICFACSKSNQEILRLSPATKDLCVSDAVRIESVNGEIRWLIPGVEVAIHSMDLSAGTADNSFSVCVEHSGEERTIGVESDESNRVPFLQVAEQIEFHFHESDQPVIPSIEDCQLQAIEPDKLTALFHWKHDKLRTYRLTGHDGTWSLFQTYQDDNSVPYDAMVPLKIAEASFSFTEASAPGTSLSPVQAATLIGKFGLGAAFDKLSKTPSGHADNNSRIKDILVRLVADLSPLRWAASFATNETAGPLQQRTGQFEWNGEVVNLYARPDPAGRRVVFESWIDAPSRAYPAVRMTIKFPGFDVTAISFDLNELGGRLQGRVSVALAWRDFSAMTDTPVEIEIEPETKA